MKYLKTFEQLFEAQPAYQNTPTSYKNSPTSYKNSPTGYKNSDVSYMNDMSSELEEEIVDDGSRPKLDYDVDYSSDIEVLNVIENTGIFTEYEPRLSVILDGVVIGGIAYEITNDEDGKIYNFDIAVKEEYQGYGIAKKLIDRMIDDAKTIGCDYLKADVVNSQLALYLEKIGFDVSEDDYKQTASYSL